MAGLPCLSRDQEQRRARGLSTCRAPIHHLQNGSRTRHRSQQLVLSRSPLRLVRAGLVGVGVQVSPGLASAAAAAHAIVSFAHIISSEGRITPSCPAASPRAHDSFSPTNDTAGRPDYVRHEGFSRPLCETLGPSHVQGRRNARKAANPPRRENVSPAAVVWECLEEEVKARRRFGVSSAGYTRLILQIVAQSQQPARRRGQMTWSQVRRSASGTARPRPSG